MAKKTKVAPEDSMRNTIEEMNEKRQYQEGLERELELEGIMGNPENCDLGEEFFKNMVDLPDNLVAHTEANEVATNQGRPERFSPEWHPYVMSLFEEDELVNGNPKVEALARIAQRLFGEIHRSESRIIQSPTPDNGYMATAEHTIEIGRNYDNVFCYVGVGDSNPDNTDAPYNKFSTIMASNRAEGRALRKLLGLKKVISAEEMAKSDISNDDSPKYCDDPQLNVLDIVCKRLDIDVMKYVNTGEKTYKTIKEVPTDTCRKMLADLDKYQAKGPDGIPVHFKGYKSDWRK